MNARRAKLLAILGFYAQRLLPGVVGIVVLPWLFRIGGPVIYQRYSIAVLLIGSIAVLCGSWLSQSAMRNLRAAGYDRASLGSFCRLMLPSCAVAALATAVLLQTVFPSDDVCAGWLEVAAAALTAQTSVLPVMQAIGRHASCVISELGRTTLPVVLVGLAAARGSAGTASVEIALAVGCLLSLAALLPGLRSTFAQAPATESPPPLLGWRAMLRYGGPLSAYNGLSMGLQYAARATLVRLEGATLVGASLIMAADLAQKIVASLSAPLVASQVPGMIVAYNEGRLADTIRIGRRLQWFIAGCAGVLLAATLVADAARLWIFQHDVVAVGAAVAIVANALLQLAVCAQKPLEFSGRTTRVAGGMGAAGAAAVLTERLLPPSFQHLVPGINLLLAASLLYALVSFLAAQVRRPRAPEAVS